MPSLKAVRTRIASVKSTQKITRAMKLVAAARLRRAQDAIVAARPYAEALAEAVAEVAARAGDDSHPMLRQRDGRRLALITLTSDRGLCGGFNANICRASQRFVEERIKSSTADEVQINVVGRKGRDYFRRRRLKITHELTGVTGEQVSERSRDLALTVGRDFLDGRVDGVFLAYNEFKSAMSQRVVVVRLLPVAPAASAPPEAGNTDFLYEPGKKQILDMLLPLFIQSQIYRAFLESIASEFGARMTAMDSATNNASDMIDRLTLQYNRARQAAITKELMEIIGGAEALKG
jgi:F-type H+-transporting ATPase subunit gamma